MNKKTINEISKLVKGSLPSMVGDELKEILDDYNDALNEAKRLEKRVELYKEKEKDLNGVIREHEARVRYFEDREEKFKEREARVKERERFVNGAEIRQEEAQLSFENNILKEQISKTQEFMINMSHNTQFRKKVTTETPVAIPGHSGSNGLDQLPYVSREKTKEETTITEE